MIEFEWFTDQADEIYEEFARQIGEKHWRKRVSDLTSHARGRPLLATHLSTENRIAFQLNHLHELKQRHGRIAALSVEDRTCYSAIGFAAQIASLMRAMSPEKAERLRRRVHGALKNPDDMHAMQLELAATTHFVRRGLAVVWPETTGTGRSDLLLPALGIDGLEIECKSISDDKGRKIHRQDVLDFYSLLWPHIKAIRIGLRIGLGVVLTLPDRLPTKHAGRVQFATSLARLILTRRGAASEEANVRVFEFDVADLGDIPDFPTEVIREKIDAVTATRNEQFILVGNVYGGALAIAIKCAKDDTFLKRTFDMLSESARSQLSGLGQECSSSDFKEWMEPN